MFSQAGDVTLAATHIKRDAPYLTTGYTLSPQLRYRLAELAVLAGMARAIADTATDNDLIGVYLVALKDGVAAIRTAKKLQMRLDNSLLGFPEPSPAPEPPTAPASVDKGAVLAIVRHELLDVLKPLQEALNTHGRETDEALSQLGENMATHGKNLRELKSQLLADVAEIALGAATEALKQLTPTRLEVTTNHAEPATALGLVHRDTAKIINALSAGVNVYLHGPAGAGKTTVGRKCAEAFKLQFYFAAKVESEYMLLGFKDAKGETVRTQFREAYEHGGVFLFDELDASSPSAVVAMNAALANGVCPFPDGIVSRHKGFYALAAGNTKLTGANRQYAGRNQLDAASIDRFAFIEFDYDDQLELALATDLSWAKYVQAVRKAVAARGLNHLVTPRATYDGCKLLASGFDRETVKQMCVYKGLDADTMAQIERTVRA